MPGPLGKSELQEIFEKSLVLEPPRFVRLEAKEQSGSLNLDERIAAVGLVVRNNAKSGKLEFLLTLRGEDLKEHAAQVSFPGGMVEESERDRPLAALDREFEEEVGIPAGSISWSSSHWDVLPSLYGIAVYPYLGFLDADRCPEPLVVHPVEVADYAWLELDGLFDTALWARRELSRAPWEWRGWRHVTWGLTAAFLALFVRRISGSLPLAGPAPQGLG